MTINLDEIPDFAKMAFEKLHPDLEPYVEEGSFGPMLRHPLVYQVPLTIPGYANRYYQQKLEDTKKALESKNYKSYVWLHERPYRLHAFEEIQQYLTDREYWSLLGSIWIDTENAWANLEQWREFFSSERGEREWLMDWDEQMAYAGLPEMVTVYRGYQPGLNEDGISWTIKREVAEKFATRLGKKGKVLEMRVKRERIVAVFTGRHEYEVVII